MKTNIPFLSKAHWLALRAYPGRAAQVVRRSNVAAMTGNTAYSLVLRFGSNIILTRLLAPSEFGVMLVVLTVLTIFTMLSETGIHAYTVRTPEATTPESLRTLHTIQILRGVLIAACVFVFAGFFANLFGKEDLKPVFQAVAILPLVGGFAGLGPTLMNRQRRQRYNEGVKVVVVTIQTVLTLALAYWLRNSWALIIGMISSAPLQLLANKAAYDFPILQFGFHRSTIRKLTTFSKYIFLSTILTLILSQFDKAFISSKFDLTVAGLYSLAFSISQVLVQFTQKYNSSILYADLAALHRDGKLNRHSFYSEMWRIRSFLAFIAGGAITYGPTFFAVIFDERYQGAGVFFSILVLRSVLLSFKLPHQTVLIALGNTRSKFIGDLLQLAYVVIMAPLGFHFFGAYGLAFAAATYELPSLIYCTILSRKVQMLSLKQEGITALALGVGVAVGIAGAFGTDVVLSYFFPQGY
ncbi:MAG: oligosaccharide flippase family protein [Parvularcula sp.]|jgi:O-antigen/teichoic acid export membrane protein|nr:oligosaccharide flippase family protein [Parvularcula sp.]